MSDPQDSTPPAQEEEALAIVVSDEDKGLPALLWGSGLCLLVVILVAYLLLQ